MTSCYCGVNSFLSILDEQLFAQEQPIFTTENLKTWEVPQFLTAWVNCPPNLDHKSIALHLDGKNQKDIFD